MYSIPPWIKRNVIQSQLQKLTKINGKIRQSINFRRVFLTHIHFWFAVNFLATLHIFYTDAQAHIQHV